MASEHLQTYVCLVLTSSGSISFEDISFNLILVIAFRTKLCLLVQWGRKILTSFTNKLRTVRHVSGLELAL